MELFGLLTLVLVVAALIFFRKPINRTANYMEGMVIMNTSEAATDFEERTLVVQQRLDALDEAHPNRVRFADIDTLFASKAKTVEPAKGKK